MSAAVTNNGRVLKYCLAGFQRWRGLVLTAMKDRGEYVKYAHEDLRSNASFMLEALAVYDQALFYAAPKLRRDRAFVLQACHVTGRAMARPTSLATLGERRRATLGQRPSDSFRRLGDHFVLLHCGGSLPEF